MEKSRKKLLSLIKQNLREMAMKFDDEDQSRPDPGIQDKLSQGDTPLKKVPLPSTGEEPNMNFQELLASDRYKQVVQNVRRYTGVNAPLRPGINGMMPLLQMMMGAHEQIVRTEMTHRPELEDLAVKLVIKELGIPDGSLQFDAKIIGMGEFDVEDFNMEKSDQPNPDPIEIEKELFDELETLDLEKAKRRLINSIMQGASKRGHYMYHLVEPELRRITGSDALINQYGILMSINDAQYWQISDETVNQANSGGEAVGGKENVDRNTDPPTIKVRALNFPILVHELIKGIMEVIAIQGRPEDEGGEEGEDGEFSDDSEDTLEQEIWDLRLGPSIWDRLRRQFPEEILIDENKALLQLYLIQSIFKLPAKNFLVFMREILGGTPRGKRMMNELMDGVNRIFNEEDYEEPINTFEEDVQDLTDETSDEEMDRILDSMNLKNAGRNPETNVEPDDDSNLSDEEKMNRMLDAMNDAKKNRGK